MGSQVVAAFQLFIDLGSRPFQGFAFLALALDAVDRVDHLVVDLAPGDFTQRDELAQSPHAALSRTGTGLPEPAADCCSELERGFDADNTSAAR